MSKVQGTLVGGNKGEEKVTVKISGTFAGPSQWDEFFAQLKALGTRYGISVTVPKKPVRNAGAPAKKKAVKSSK